MEQNKELSTDKQCDIHVVMHTLLCVRKYGYFNITIGKKYKLIKEDSVRYEIISDIGVKERYSKDCFKKQRVNNNCA